MARQTGQYFGMPIGGVVCRGRQDRPASCELTLEGMAGPMGCPVRRLGAGQRHHPRRLRDDVKPGGVPNTSASESSRKTRRRLLVLAFDSHSYTI
jgi:hypothetical protein